MIDDNNNNIKQWSYKWYNDNKDYQLTTNLTNSRSCLSLSINDTIMLNTKSIFKNSDNSSVIYSSSIVIPLASLSFTVVV